MANNSKLDLRLQQIPAEIWSKITKIDELKGQWIAGARLSPQVLNRLKRSVLITSTGASTRIEGAKLSDEDVEKLMRGISMQKFTDRDKQEVKGDYKKTENKVEMIDGEGKSIDVLFDTTPAYLTPKEMQELVEWTQKAINEKKYHPLLVIANFLVEFLAIHPFQDGNGRLSRILTNLLMLKEGYLYIPYVSHEKLVEDNKPDYYMALRKSQKTFKTENENIIPWLDFFLPVVFQQSKMAISLLSEENIEKILSVKQLAVWKYLQTVEEASPKEIAQKTKISRPTVNQIVDKLIRLKKIERLGQGRSTRYRKL